METVQLKIRLPKDLKAIVADEAGKNCRTQAAEISFRLRKAYSEAENANTPNE